jgi:hypothetical protein
MHRWRSPAAIPFDLVPAGDHPGGSRSDWDALALKGPVVLSIDGVVIRHVPAAIFVAMKLGAYADRGNGNVHASHDIEDVIALMASRPSIVDDVRGAHAKVRKNVARFAAALAASGIAEDVVAGHLNNADDVRYAVRVVLDRLADIATMK